MGRLFGSVNFDDFWHSAIAAVHFIYIIFPKGVLGGCELRRPETSVGPTVN